MGSLWVPRAAQREVWLLPEDSVRLLGTRLGKFSGLGASRLCPFYTNP